MIKITEMQDKEDFDRRFQICVGEKLDIKVAEIHVIGTFICFIQTFVGFSFSMPDMDHIHATMKQIDNMEL